MDELCSRFLIEASKSLEWQNLGGHDTPARSASSDKTNGRQVSLRSLCRQAVIEATIKSLFGDLLHLIDPKVDGYMAEFGDHAWMVVFRYAHLLHLPVTKSRTKLLSILKEVVQLPKSARGGVSAAVEGMLAAFDVVELDVESRASALLMALWV